MTSMGTGAHVGAHHGVHMLSSQRLLIIESEFLIALDIQRVIEDSNALQTVFARSFSEAAALADRFGTFDLAIVNAPGPDDLPIAAELAAAGPAIIVCTAGTTDLDATPLAGAAVLMKPFSDEQLRAACSEALAAKGR